MDNSQHQPVFIWPGTEDKFWEIEDFFYGVVPEKPLAAWSNDELAAWLFGSLASKSKFSGFGMNKLLLSEFWFRQEAIKAKLGLTVPPEPEIVIEEDGVYEYVDEVDSETLEEIATYQATRPSIRYSPNYFCPDVIHEDILKFFKERLLLAEAIIATKRDIQPSEDEPRSWSDQLLMDVMVLEQIQSFGVNRRTTRNRSLDFTSDFPDDLTTQVLDLLISRAIENNPPFEVDIDRSRMFLSEHESFHEDLVNIATFLEKTPSDSDAFNSVFDIGLSELSKVSLHEFVKVMQRVQLSSSVSQRLKRVQKLSELTYPHVPELTYFSVLWAALSRPSELEYRDEPAGVTQTAIESLFETSIDDRIEILRHPCVMVRTAVALGGYVAPLDDVIDEDAFISVQSAYWDLSSAELEVRLLELRAMQDKDARHQEPLPTLPTLSATECQCIPGFDAVENFLNSRGLFAPVAPQEMKQHIRGIGDGFWSSVPGNPNDIMQSIADNDGFTFSINKVNPGAREQYTLTFALGELFMTFSMVQEHPFEEMKPWVELWEERTDMFQLLMDLSAFKESESPTSRQQLPKRKYLWVFEDLPTDDGEDNPNNLLMTYDVPHIQYVPVGTEDFVQSFYFLKKALSERN